jgi:predicted RNase H-like HicB family nuclease
MVEEPEGGFTVTVPQIPGCVTYGQTEDEAVAMATDAISLCMAHFAQRGEPAPQPKRVFTRQLPYHAVSA